MPAHATCANAAASAAPVCVAPCVRAPIFKLFFLLVHEPGKVGDLWLKGLFFIIWVFLLRGTYESIHFELLTYHLGGGPALLIVGFPLFRLYFILYIVLCGRVISTAEKSTLINEW